MKDDRFWAKVDKSGECWIWTGHVGKGKDDGYGRFNSKLGSTLAHRVSWILSHGAIATGLRVLHKCDNRRCVNPSHLFLGTDQDNVDDMIFKGRDKHDKSPLGDEHGRAKLSSEQVSSIRQAIAQRISVTSIARTFGVSIQNISAIKHRKTWRHLP